MTCKSFWRIAVLKTILFGRNGVLPGFFGNAIFLCGNCHFGQLSLFYRIHIEIFKCEHGCFIRRLSNRWKAFVILGFGKAGWGKHPKLVCRKCFTFGVRNKRTRHIHCVMCGLWKTAPKGFHVKLQHSEVVCIRISLWLLLIETENRKKCFLLVVVLRCVHGVRSFPLPLTHTHSKILYILNWIYGDGSSCMCRSAKRLEWMLDILIYVIVIVLRHRTHQTNEMWSVCVCLCVYEWAGCCMCTQYVYLYLYFSLFLPEGSCAINFIGSFSFSFEHCSTRYKFTISLYIPFHVGICTTLSLFLSLCVRYCEIFRFAKMKKQRQLTKHGFIFILCSILVFKHFLSALQKIWKKMYEIQITFYSQYAHCTFIVITIYSTAFFCLINLYAFSPIPTSNNWIVADFFLRCEQATIVKLNKES